MKQIIQITLALLIFMGLIVYSTLTASAASPRSQSPSDELLDSELPPDLFDEDCDGGPACPGRIFLDMPPAGHWAHVPIDWALTHHITSGTSEDSFSPGKGCTRSQAVMFLWRANGSPEPESEDCPFSDVSANAYYYKAVLWAIEHKITSGTTATTFSPNRICTRAQIVTFLWVSRGSPAPSASAANAFQDVDEDAYYKNAVLWAAETGVTGGTSPTSFSPNNACTRAQIVTFLYKSVHG